MSNLQNKIQGCLSADGLLSIVKRGFGKVSEDSRKNPTISLQDILMSAYAMFSLKYESLLMFERDPKKDNLSTIYGINKIPSDTHMRTIIDEVNPDSIRPIFKDVFRVLQRGKKLEKYVYMDGAYLLLLDGTGYFSSNCVKCNSCLIKKHKDGTVSYSHQMLGGVIANPSFKTVIPLAPEPIIKQDGETKNDCERNAAKRFLAKTRKDHPKLKFIVVEDGLSSNAPHLKEILAHSMDFISVVKEGDHQYLFETVNKAQEDGKVTSYELPDSEDSSITHRFRFVNQVPLNKLNEDFLVNFIEYWEIKNNEVTKHFAWVTSITITKDNAYKIMRAGRCRWKIENETFNTLKNQGYQFEHNFGHGYNNLSVNFATLMMLAFLMDQVQQFCCILFQRVLAHVGAKTALWRKMQGLFDNIIFSSMQQLYLAILHGFKKPIMYNLLNSG